MISPGPTELNKRKIRGHTVSEITLDEYDPSALKLYFSEVQIEKLHQTGMYKVLQDQGYKIVKTLPLPRMITPGLMKYGEVVGPGGKHWHVLQRVDPKAEEYYEQQRKYLIDGTPFPHPAHVSPYTGEPYDPLWGYSFDKKTRKTRTKEQ